MINTEHAKYYTAVPFTYGSSMIHTVQLKKYLNTYQCALTYTFLFTKRAKIVEKSFVIRAMGNRKGLNHLIFSLIWFSFPFSNFSLI